MILLPHEFLALEGQNYPVKSSAKRCAHNGAQKQIQQLRAGVAETLANESLKFFEIAHKAGTSVLGSVVIISSTSIKGFGGM